MVFVVFFFFKQKTAYEMSIGDWSSDVCSSDLAARAPVAVEPLDTAALAQRLAGALRFKTISYQDSSQFDAREFDGFQRYLRTTFPKLYATLKLEKVNGYGLLYEWPGSDPSVPPIE